MNKQLDIIDHIAIQVKNIEESVCWYKKRFNCVIKYQDESWALLEFSNMSLAFVLEDQHPYHFAILREDISPYGKAIKHRDGTSSVYIKDLDENSIEMLKRNSNE